MEPITAALHEVAVAFEHLSIALKRDVDQTETTGLTKEDPELLMNQIKEIIRPNAKQYGKKIRALLAAFNVKVPSDIPANRLKEFKERLQGLVGGQG